MSRTHAVLGEPDPGQGGPLPERQTSLLDELERVEVDQSVPQVLAACQTETRSQHSQSSVPVFLSTRAVFTDSPSRLVPPSLLTTSTSFPPPTILITSSPCLHTYF